MRARNSTAKDHPMNTALIPIDGSSSSLRALAFALHALRGRPDAQIHVLNVQAPL
ncbi:universal stress protein, partial [Methylibium sp.]|uniref:universal stress protein n=1 Tax=Methylibium sp. TaxID=2067992 RepID=UPI00345BBF23